MKNKIFEKELPSGYGEIMHIDATSKRFGTVLMLVTFLITALLIVLSLVLARSFIDVPMNEADSAPVFEISLYLGLIIGFVAFLPAIVIHELLHGAAYKGLTGEKLTYGFTLTVAFCGVPNIYVYRRTALIALLAPFTVFSAVLIPTGIISLILAAAGSSAALTTYFAASALFALHCGGCSGDLYVTLLYIFKYKSPSTLMRDTGPAQSFYLRSEDAGAEPSNKDRNI